MLHAEEAYQDHNSHKYDYICSKANNGGHVKIEKRGVLKHKREVILKYYTYHCSVVDGPPLSLQQQKELSRRLVSIYLWRKISYFQKEIDITIGTAKWDINKHKSNHNENEIVLLAIKGSGFQYIKTTIYMYCGLTYHHTVQSF